MRVTQKDMLFLRLLRIREVQEWQGSQDFQSGHGLGKFDIVTTRTLLVRLMEKGSLGACNVDDVSSFRNEASRTRVNQKLKILTFFASVLRPHLPLAIAAAATTSSNTASPISSNTNDIEQAKETIDDDLLPISPSSSLFLYLTNSFWRLRKEKKMDAVQQLPPHQQQEFMKHLEQMQLKDSLT